MTGDRIDGLFRSRAPDPRNDVGSMDQELRAKPLPIPDDAFADLHPKQRRDIATAAAWAAGLVAGDPRACGFLVLLLDEIKRGVKEQVAAGGLDQRAYDRACGSIDGVEEVKRLLTNSERLATVRSEMLGSGGAPGH